MKNIINYKLLHSNYKNGSDFADSMSSKVYWAVRNSMLGREYLDISIVLNVITYKLGPRLC
jgi:hypothetical protein